MSGLIAISPVVRRALAAWVAFCPILLAIAAEPAAPPDSPANSLITNSVSEQELDRFLERIPVKKN